MLRLIAVLTRRPRFVGDAADQRGGCPVVPSFAPAVAMRRERHGCLTLIKAGKELKRIATITALVSLALAPSASAASMVFIKGGNVWLGSADGTVERQVTTSGGWDAPSQADDGTILAQQGTQLFRLDRNGNSLAPAVNTSFTGAPPTWAGPVNPVISPDGINQAYDGEITTSPIYDYGCGCWVYTHQFATWWGSATQYSQPNQTLGQQDYVDPAWIDNTHLMLTSTGILIDQVATYAIGAPDNSMTGWFSDPDPNVQALEAGAITRSADKLAFVANLNGGVGNEIRIYQTTGPPPSAPIDQCNIGPNSFQSLRVSFSSDGQSLAYDAPDGIHLVTLTGFPSCAGLTDRLIIPGGAEPYFGPTDIGQSTATTQATTTTQPTTTTHTTPACKAPRLHGLSLAAARRRLLSAHCRPGHVRTAHSARDKHRGLIVLSQQPRAGATRPADTKVNIVLGLPARDPRH
jgi:hypothetical protein